MILLPRKPFFENSCLKAVYKTSVFERGKKAATPWIIPTVFSLANVLFYESTRQYGF
jgi:hypothetical protein